MNQFSYQKTMVTMSAFDFSGKSTNGDEQNECEINATLSTPKEPSKSVEVKCRIQIELRAKGHDLPFVKVDTVSSFRLCGEVEPSTLEQDAKKYCLKISMEKAIARAENLIELHIGTRVGLPVPTDI